VLINTTTRSTTKLKTTMKYIFLFLLFAVLSALAAADVCGFCGFGSINPNGPSFNNDDVSCANLSVFLFDLYDGNNCDAMRRYFHSAVSECGCIDDQALPVGIDPLPLCGFCQSSSIKVGQQFLLGTSPLHCHDLPGFMASLYNGNNCDFVSSFFQGAVNECGCVGEEKPEDIVDPLPLCGFCEDSSIDKSPSFFIGTTPLHCHDLPGYIAAAYNGANCAAVSRFFQGAVDACGCADPTPVGGNLRQ
jgi:hypothetical protein